MFDWIRLKPERRLKLSGVSGGKCVKKSGIKGEKGKNRDHARIKAAFENTLLELKRLAVASNARKAPARTNPKSFQSI